MGEREKMVKLEFSYTDEFNQETRVTKTLTPDVIEMSSAFEVLLDEFRLFLLTSGFSNELVSKVTIQ